ncbi:MAG TPA: hypothetical protein VK760_06005, partial [Candidatus Acidoferrales bacterium]|nr:hypothetical protein [Candidatus Acidoferrales bacterium]
NNCYNAPCTGLTTILPTHGIDWSLTNNKTAPTAWTPVQFGSVNSTNAKPSGTAQIDYIGSTPGGPAYAAQANPANPWTGGHFYQANFSRADYQNSTPWTPTTTRKDALSILIQNDTAGNSPQNEITNGTSYVLAVGFPSYISTSLVALDAASTATWQTVACPTNGTFGSTYLCYAFKTNGTNIAGCGTAPCTGGSQTIVLDLPLPVTSFDFQDLTIQAYLGNEFTWFTLGANATKTETVYNGQGGSGGTSSTVDSLGLGAWSLNSNLMSAAFTPSTAGSGQTNVPLSIAVSNTSNGADPNPDAIDAVVIETQGGTAANYVPSAESVTGVTGWSYLGNLTSTTPVNPTRDYWFGVCPSATAGWFTAAGGPPQSNGVTIPLTAQRATRMASCGANEANSLGAWTSATLGTAIINLTLAGPFSTNQTFYMYAHGANGGGWSAPKAFTLNVTSESASAGFSAVGATPPPGAVATNALPTINGSPNYFTYTVKNTSAATKINKIFVTLPAFDINGLAAQNGSAQWKLVTPLTSTISFTTLPTGQVGTWGCSYNTNGANTFNPVPGVSDGQIEIDCTTGIPAGDSLLMTFEAQSPGIQSDTYAFPSKLETTSGVATGPTWIGDQDIQESFSVGLTVVVNPSNPGAGGSTPTVSCSQCAFSGSTIDFGAITAGNAVPGSDVVRASVIYSGSTVAANWTLTVQTNLNPACTGTCQGTNELLTGVDQTASNGPTGTGKCGAIASSIGNNTYHVVPTASALTIATGPETKCVLPNVYDVIQNMEVSIGSENAIGRTATVTYTLIP